MRFLLGDWVGCEHPDSDRRADQWDTHVKDAHQEDCALSLIAAQWGGIGDAMYPMLDALRRHGWGNYSLFMRPDGLMFGYVEVAESFEASLEGMAGEEINSKWQELMAPYFEIPEGSHADQNMIELEEVFHLD